MSKLLDDDRLSEILSTLCNPKLGAELSGIGLEVRSHIEALDELIRESNRKLNSQLARWEVVGREFTVTREKALHQEIAVLKEELRTARLERNGR